MRRRDRNSYWNVACRNVMALQRYYDGLVPLVGLGLGAHYAAADARGALMRAKAYYHWKSRSASTARVHRQTPVDKALRDLVLWKARDAGRTLDGLVDVIDHWHPMGAFETCPSYVLEAPGIDPVLIGKRVNSALIHSIGAVGRSG